MSESQLEQCRKVGINTDIDDVIILLKLISNLTMYSKWQRHKIGEGEIFMLLYMPPMTVADILTT